LLGEISMRTDRLRERGDAAVGYVDLHAHPIDDDIDREERGEEAQNRCVYRGIERK
jgi:hypothetical protein